MLSGGLEVKVTSPSASRSQGRPAKRRRSPQSKALRFRRRRPAVMAGSEGPAKHRVPHPVIRAPRLEIGAASHCLLRMGRPSTATATTTREPLPWLLWSFLFTGAGTTSSVSIATPPWTPGSRLCCNTAARKSLWTRPGNSMCGVELSGGVGRGLQLRRMGQRLTSGE